MPTEKHDWLDALIEKTKAEAKVSRLLKETIQENTRLRYVVTELKSREVSDQSPHLTFQPNMREPKPPSPDGVAISHAIKAGPQSFLCFDPRMGWGGFIQDARP